MFRKSCLFFLKYTEYFVLVFGLVITLMLGVWGFLVDIDSVRLKDAILFQKSAKVDQTLQVYVDRVWNNVHSIKGFYLGSVEVTDEELEIFVANLRQDDGLSEYAEISFVEVLENEEVSNFESGVEIRYGNDFVAMIDEEREVQFIESQSILAAGGAAVFSGKNLWYEDDKKVMIEELLSTKKRRAQYFPDTDRMKSGVLFSEPVLVDSGIIGVVNLFIPVMVIDTVIAESVDGDLGWSWLVDGEVVSAGNRNGDQIDSNSFVSVLVSDNNFWNVALYKDGEEEYFTGWTLVANGVLISFALFVLARFLSRVRAKNGEITDGFEIDLMEYKRALDSSSNHVVITNPDGLILYANNAACRMTGFDRKDMVGQTPRLWGRQMDNSFYENMWNVIKNEKKVFAGEIKNIRKNGEIYDAEVTISPILDQISGKLTGYIGIESDVTNKKKAEAELKRAIELMVGRELKMADLKMKIGKLDDEKQT